MMRHLYIGLLCLGLLLSGGVQAQPGGATHYAELTVVATKVDAVIPYTVVYLSNLDATFWSNVQADGDDIRFTLEDGTTEIAFHKVSINTGTDTGLYLVKSSAWMSTSVNTKIRIHWGNASATAYGPTDTYGRNAVFSDYAAFYTPGMTLTDLTGNGYDLTAYNSPGTTASGLEGLTAATYNGTDQYHGVTSDLGITGWPVSFESLSRFDTHTVIRHVMALGNTTKFDTFLTHYISTTPTFVSRASGTTGAGSTAGTFTTQSAATWYMQYTGRSGATGTTTSRVVGVSVATNSTTISEPTALFDNLAIGANKAPFLGSYFDGDIAFAVVSDSARSADYLATVNRAWTDAGFTTYGASVAHSGAGTTDGYAGTVSNVDYLSGTAWSNPANAEGSNTGTYADAAIPTGEASDRLWAVNYDNSAIPADASINEIRAYVYRQDADGDSEVNDEDVRLVVGGSVVGTSKGVGTLWPLTAAESAAYTWAQAEVTSLGITAANVKASNFGIALVAVEGSPGFAADARVYYVRMEVDYTASGEDGSGAWYLLY